MDYKDVNVKIGDIQIWHSENDGHSSGLDADTVDGIQGSQIVRNDTDNTITGTVTVNYLKVVGTTPSGGSFYSGTTDPTDSTRLNYNGYFYATRVYNAVYNDFADSYILHKDLSNDDIYGKILAVNEYDEAVLADEHHTVILGVASDTYGYLTGASHEEILENKKVPIAVSGFVTVHIDESFIDSCKPGNFVVPYKEGKGKIITKEEIINYFGKIVGVVIKYLGDNKCKIKVTNY